MWRSIVVVLLTSAAAVPNAPEDDIAVRVQTAGPSVIVDVAMPVPASTAQSWDVLTDYAHMAQFVSNLKVSEITSQQGNVLEVHQAGEAKRGPLHFAFETVRAVELKPPVEIRSTLVKGEFKSYVFTTRIDPAPSGVVVVNHGEYVPNRWVPPIIGPALIEAETRKQYAELRAEILRRKSADVAAQPAARAQEALS